MKCQKVLKENLRSCKQNFKENAGINVKRSVEIFLIFKSSRAIFKIYLKVKRFLFRFLTTTYLNHLLFKIIIKSKNQKINLSKVAINFHKFEVDIKASGVRKFNIFLKETKNNYFFMKSVKTTKIISIKNAYAFTFR